jgi:signal transduction histidine kinase
VRCRGNSWLDIGCATIVRAVPVGLRLAQLIGDTVLDFAGAPPSGDEATPAADGDDIAQARRLERLQLCRDLHDSVSPILAVLQLRMEGVVLLMDANTDAGAALAEAQQDVGAAVSALREIIRDLAAPGRIGTGRRPTLRGFLESRAQEFSALTVGGLRVTVEIPPETDAIPGEVQLALQRITGEALANVARHAKASECHIRADLTGGGINLYVADNGIGFSRVKNSPGMGLPSMCARTREFGGSFTVTENEESGSVVHIYLPLPAAGPRSNT